MKEDPGLKPFDPLIFRRAKALRSHRKTTAREITKYRDSPFDFAQG